MAVSKRLRYEVLRRDNHACRYCGSIAPEVVLQIDHVVPLALGGTDDPSNLVAACVDCNRGKSSAAAHPQTIEDVGSDAVRWAAAMRDVFDRRLAEIEQSNAYLASFEDIWSNWRRGDKPIPLPGDWQRSIEKWYGMGVPMELLERGVRSAMTKRNLTGWDAEFRYMAGVVWGCVSEAQQEAAGLLTVEAPAPSHCISGTCGVHDAESGYDCPRCGQRGCDWHCGYERGDFERWESMYASHGYEIYQHLVLAQVCDQGGYREPTF